MLLDKSGFLLPVESFNIHIVRILDQNMPETNPLSHQMMISLVEIGPTSQKDLIDTVIQAKNTTTSITELLLHIDTNIKTIKTDALILIPNTKNDAMRIVTDISNKTVMKNQKRFGGTIV